ncbi:MAG: hypothetical protein UW46_C0004G0057 [Candidatus Yanofskybacteria bacterium GW2011_GWF1_44_227]|uniref:YjzC-like protein n=1 Tax=Candidatus Yanofskybacteria bacterium GW2011_GWE2_40_11 TaxID=1619033 RepID=A0A0G0TRU1_9BACT|nr:MAG: hypothetical protein UT75_C0007G0030 [Candidatus Yanofskybacteria bacterium GW2011_GWE2_40_11]KKT15621.1 MAG: hypothetical protein UV97_C0004G0037 [Candidatus Yanofskybacteria bacterium GW2011_GWF2_43_596]KKT53330.1 MAG: hypothetical protein UW46_C0004G0057 [Candidatus Yanofskybacteria bacterium GW2011_GWF1_44_227]OGN35959.1 MAG: hypothetical protein A2207_02775 [Candidatus Yanofskybacteria bacterium RIFOXYA1_FULL_44_17]OGN36439.1 MAG: hypothetical protein A2241_01710 [Candidatus Yanofs
MSKKHVVVHTGEVTPKSGQYHPAGAPRNREITLSKGDRVPPNNQGKQQRFTIIDPTKVKNR